MELGKDCKKCENWSAHSFDFGAISSFFYLKTLIWQNYYFLLKKLIYRALLF